MGAKLSVLGLIMSSPPYLRCAMVRFPLISHKDVCRTAPAIPGLLRGWSFCEIMDQAGAGFHKPGQQQNLLFPVEAGPDDYTKEISSPSGLIFNPVGL